MQCAIALIVGSALERFCAFAGNFAAAEGILFSDCPCVRPCVSDHILSLWTRYLTNRWWLFHRCSWDKDELIKFWDQKVKGQGHDETVYGQKSLVHKCIFQTKAYWLTVRRPRSSSSVLYCLKWYWSDTCCESRITVALYSQWDGLRRITETEHDRRMRIEKNIGGKWDWKVEDDLDRNGEVSLRSCGVVTCVHWGIKGHEEDCMSDSLCWGRVFRTVWRRTGARCRLVMYSFSASR